MRPNSLDPSINLLISTSLRFQGSEFQAVEPTVTFPVLGSTPEMRHGRDLRHKERSDLFPSGVLGVGFGRRPFQRPDQKMATRITIIMAIKAT
jgi:hypothetical protein